MGYGHVYSPEDYLDAWIEVAAIDNWSPERVQALKALLMKRSQQGDGYEYRGG